MRHLAVAAFILIIAPWTALAADAEGNKELFRRYIEVVWNQRDLAAADRYLAPEVIEHNPNLPQAREGRKRFISAIQAAFSDYHAEIQEIVAEGDMVVARVQWTGTQDGAFQGRPPTGKKLRFSTADFLRIRDGRFVEHWDVVDSLPRAIALGLVAPPAQNKPEDSPASNAHQGKAGPL